jgi:hypothetical protein
MALRLHRRRRAVSLLRRLIAAQSSVAVDRGSAASLVSAETWKVTTFTRRLRRNCVAISVPGVSGVRWSRRWLSFRSHPPLNRSIVMAGGIEHG